jgi:hypothetical protein
VSREPWEIYTVLADAGAELEGESHLDANAVLPAGSACCAS